MPADHKLRSVFSPMPGIWQKVLVNMARCSLFGLADGAGCPEVTLATFPRPGRTRWFPCVYPGKGGQSVLSPSGVHPFLIGLCYVLLDDPDLHPLLGPVEEVGVEVGLGKGDRLHEAEQKPGPGSLVLVDKVCGEAVRHTANRVTSPGKMPADGRVLFSP